LAQENKLPLKERKLLERELGNGLRQRSKRGRQTNKKPDLRNYDKLMSQDQETAWFEKIEIYIPNGPRLGTNGSLKLKV